MSFIHDDFLLSTKPRAACTTPLPRTSRSSTTTIICRRRTSRRTGSFKNLFEIWLEGDHYKWRAMRCNGVPEKFITGDATPFEKFKAWATTVPHTLRNPLYHWTHLELKRYFGIDDLLSEKTAVAIWEKTCLQLDRAEMGTRNILRSQKVKALCTTDDPTDDLAWHRKCAEDRYEVGVYPTFRPDKALAVHQPEAWNAWCDRLSAASGIEVKSYASLLEALEATP
jgi:glucuronate isomerase